MNCRKKYFLRCDNNYNSNEFFISHCLLIKSMDNNDNNERWRYELSRGDRVSIDNKHEWQFLQWF